MVIRFGTYIKILLEILCRICAAVALNSCSGQWGCCRYFLQAGLLFDYNISRAFPSFFVSYVLVPGEQKTNLQLLLEFVSFLIDSFHYPVSSINVKAEVTLNVGECTEDALLYNMEESVLTFLSWGIEPIRDVESRKQNVATYLILFADIFYFRNAFLFQHFLVI